MPSCARTPTAFIVTIVEAHDARDNRTGRYGRQGRRAPVAPATDRRTVSDARADRLWIVEHLSDAQRDVVGDDVLDALCFGMQPLHRHAQRAIEKRFQQPMTAHDGDGQLARDG